MFMIYLYYWYIVVLLSIFSVQHFNRMNRILYHLSSHLYRNTITILGVSLPLAKSRKNRLLES